MLSESAFDAAAAHALHKPLLEQQERDQHRDGHHRGVGHNAAPQDRGLGLKVAHANHQRLVFVAARDHQRPQVKRPKLQELENRHCRKHRARQRNDHLPVDAERPRAVHVCRFVKIFRDTDEKLVEQVLINLLNNSLYFLRNRQKPEIELSAFKENGRTILSVSDNGPGIDEKEIENIFVPFYSTKEGGSGIGLSLSRQIMRLHKGTISVHSDPSVQTVVTLLF